MEKINPTNENCRLDDHLRPWQKNQHLFHSEPIPMVVEADVAVIGGGIAGVTCAYLLSCEGKNVVLIEDGEIGSGETGRTTAQLVSALDDRYFEIEEKHGKDGAVLAAKSHAAAIEKVAEIVKKERIECDFVRLSGYLFRHPTDVNETLQKELKATHRSGIKTEWINEIPSIVNAGPGLVFPQQAQFHPLKYINALCEKIVSNGGSIYTHTHADEVKDGFIQTSSGAVINAEFIVVATNTPINNRFVIHTKQHAYRSYVIAGLVEKDSIEPALWWDTGDQTAERKISPYHYVRLAPFDDKHDLLLVGGEDHKTGQDEGAYLHEEDHYKVLETWTKEFFPQWKELIYSWSGQVMEPVDGLAYIGRNPTDGDKMFVITGDSGNGMTHGTIGGMLITDLIMGRKNPWEELYDPSRINFNSTSEYIEENLNTFKQYADLFTSGDIENSTQLANNTGAVLRSGLSKIAVYRDDSGNLKSFSALCPHLGCVVHWNDGEKTFDCPCHGSRFSCEGKVINGPANDDLRPV